MATEDSKKNPKQLLQKTTHEVGCTAATKNHAKPPMQTLLLHNCWVLALQSIQATQRSTRDLPKLGSFEQIHGWSTVNCVNAARSWIRQFWWQWQGLPSSVCFRTSMVNTAKQHCSKSVQSLTVLASSDISLVGYWRSVTCQGIQETQGD